MEPPPGHIRDKQKRKLAISQRALADLEEFRRRDAKTQSPNPEGILCGSAALRQDTKPVSRT